MAKGSANPGAFLRLYVCLERPRVTPIRFKGHDTGEDRHDASTKSLRTFALAMPWVATFILFVNQALAKVVMLGIMEYEGLWPNGDGTELFHLPLPNLDNNDGTFCLGELRLDSSRPHWARANDVVRYIQDSVWNRDLWPHFGARSGDRPGVVGLVDWAGKTKDTGQAFWRKLNLSSTGVLIGQKIEEMSR